MGRRRRRLGSPAVSRDPTHDRPVARSPDHVRIRRVQLLRRLYAEQQARRSDEYLRGHGSDAFVRGTEQVFEWYRPYLPDGGRILDWGCRHAPDACLLAAEAEGELAIDGCDTVEPDRYEVFHEAARLRYRRLEHEYELPYEKGSFDAVIAAGVLEHVPMEYESIKELSRVTRTGGILVVTFLPNRWSLHEMRARRVAEDLHRAGEAHHLRTYRLGRVRQLLQATGFVVRVAGYQTHFDLLPLEPSASARRRTLSAAGRALGVGRLAPCLGLVAERLDYF
jgi:SAM-dependent methyltransferase